MWNELTLFIFGEDAPEGESEEKQKGEHGARRGPGAPRRVSHVRHTISHDTQGLAGLAPHSSTTGPSVDMRLRG